MKTTIQVGKATLELLRKVRESTDSKSYDEAIHKIVLENISSGSLFGHLGRKSRREILRGLRDKSERL